MSDLLRCEQGPLSRTEGSLGKPQQGCLCLRRQRRMHDLPGCGLKAKHVEPFWTCIDRNLRAVAEQVLVHRLDGVIRME